MARRRDAAECQQRPKTKGETSSFPFKEGHTGLVELLSEPVNSHDDDDDIDKAEIGDNRDEVDDQLLVHSQVLDIDRVETRFSTATGAKEESIDGRDISFRDDEYETQEGKANDVCICVETVNIGKSSASQRVQGSPNSVS